MTEVLVRTGYALRKINGILADAEQVLASCCSELRSEHSCSSFCRFFACLPSIKDEHEDDNEHD
jgi:hypothetical protein